MTSRLLTDRNLFLAANAIFSGSAFLLNIALPIFVGLDVYSRFTMGMQLCFLMVNVFEFGITASFLRNYQTNALLTLRSSIIYELIVYTSIGIFLIYPSALNFIFSFEQVSDIKRLILFAVMSLLIYQFSRLRFISRRQFGSVLLRACIVATGRLLSLIYISQVKCSIEELFFILAVLPFALEWVAGSLSLVREFWDITASKVWFKDSRQFLTFVYISAATYVTGVLFSYSSRLIFLFCSDLRYQEFVAELGYGMSFVGILGLLNGTIRSYCIGRLNPTNLEEIRAYLDRLRNLRLKGLMGVIAVSLALAMLVDFIKPNYLGWHAVLYTFILTISTGFTISFGLVNLLSTTLCLVHIEVLVNFLRLLLVILWTYCVYNFSPTATVVGTCLIISMVEGLFSVYVARRVYALPPLHRNH